MARLTREQSQARTKEKLLASAYEVMARYGYAGASIERIAEEAGYSKGAFYSNFANKEDIFLQLLAGNAGGDVVQLTELLGKCDEPMDLIDVLATWANNRGDDRKWGMLAIELLRMFGPHFAQRMKYPREIAVQVREAAVFRIDHDDVAHALAQPFVDAQVGGRARRVARGGFAAGERDTGTERGEAAEHTAAVGIGGKVVGAIGGVVHVVGSSNGRVGVVVRCAPAPRAAATQGGMQRPLSRAAARHGCHENVMNATITRQGGG